VDGAAGDLVVPRAVAGLAAALAPEACTGGASAASEAAARASGLQLQVSLSRNGGPLEGVQVAMQVSGDPRLASVQRQRPWAWAGTAQWLACLGLELNLVQCGDLRNAWCAALRGEPILGSIQPPGETPGHPEADPEATPTSLAP
jgi:hypothetical protein